MAVKLKDIYLGVPDGATEAESKNFEELFYDPNNKYDELMDNEEKFLVIGNKGAGKTYLAKYVSDCRQSPAFAGFCYFVGTAFLI